MPSNNRIYYAIKQVGVKALGASNNGNPIDVIFGAQDVSVSTNFTQSQIFELGQLAIYQTIEELPDVEITVSKVFDGRPLIWHLATKSATAGPDLAGRSVERSLLALSIFEDSSKSATGTVQNTLECSGMFPKTISYNFSTDGAFTESVSFVGNDKLYKNDSRVVNPAATGRQNAMSFAGAFATNADRPPSGVERSEALLFAVTGSTPDINGQLADPNATILPSEIDGINISGVNVSTNGVLGAHLTSIAISTDLGREQVDELGRRGPYFRYATFPVEVTCSIEAVSTRGDNISAVEEGIYTTSAGCSAGASNLKDQTIRIATCGGVRIYLGPKNRLQSVEYGGGTTDGGNDTNTYNYVNFNDLTVMASYDPNPQNTGGANWWANRATHLRNLT
jgi:hypothetical protein